MPYFVVQMTPSSEKVSVAIVLEVREFKSVVYSINKLVLFFASFACWFALVGSSYAATNLDVFTQSVSLQADTNQAREAAKRQALDRLLSQLSGQSMPLQRYPVLVALSDRLDQLVVSITVDERAEISDSESTNADQLDKWQSIFAEQLQSSPDLPIVLSKPLYDMTIQFNGEEILDFFTSNSIAMWGKLRPEFAVWAVYRTGADSKLLDSRDSLAISQFNQLSNERGLPTEFPLVSDPQSEAAIQDDRDDANAVVKESWEPFDLSSIQSDTSEAIKQQLRDAVWHQKFDVIEQYQSEFFDHSVDGHILVKCARTYGGQYLGQWTVLHAGEVLNYRLTSDSYVQFITEGFNRITDSILSRYAIQGSAVLQGQSTMLVTGVNTPADFMALNKLLQESALFNQLSLYRVKGDTLIFHFSSDSDLRNLYSSLMLSRKFEAISGTESLNLNWLN